MTILGVMIAINALLVLATVWNLAGGRLRLGNVLSVLACIAGGIVARLIGLEEAWPMLFLNAILALRSVWCMKRGWAPVALEKSPYYHVRIIAPSGRVIADHAVMRPLVDLNAKTDPQREAFLIKKFPVDLDAWDHS